MHYSKIEEKLNKYSNMLKPDVNSKKRVQNLIFEKFEPEVTKKGSKFNIFYFLDQLIMKIFKNKAMLAFGTLSILFVFFCVPLLWLGISSTKNLQQKELSNSYEPNFDDKKNQELDETYNEQYGYFEDEKRKEAPSEEIGSEYNLYSVPAPSSSGSKVMDMIGGIEQDIKDEDTQTPQRDRAQKRGAYINITIDDFQKRQLEMTEKVSAIGGYLLDSNTNASEKYSYGSYTVRVPVEAFDDMMNFLRKIAVSVNSENISIADKQNELTQISKTIDSKQQRISELESKSNLSQDEKNELARLKNELDTSIKQQAEIKEETEFSTIQVYMSTQEDEGANTDLEIGRTIQNVLDTLLFVLKFWINVILWSLVPIAFISPVVIVIMILIKVLRKKKQ